MEEGLRERIERFFKPASIAIVGVSTGSFRFGGTSFLQKFQESGYPGRLYPVHPRASEIRGLKVYPSIRSLPEVPDLVVVCVPAASVPAVLRECGEIGAGCVHILSSGFKELGTSEGRALEEEIASIARGKNLLILGPNCMGPYCPEGRVTAWGAIPGLAGPVGVISQSGTLTQRVTEYLCSLGMGISKAASFGNAAVLDAVDLLEFLGRDDATKAVAMYLEGVSDARRFLERAKAVNASKPVVLWRGGESEAGRRAARSHTGSMAGAGSLWEAFYRQAGVTRVESMDELVDAVFALLLLPEPRGRRVFLVGGGGGTSVVSGDACVRAGLEVSSLSAPTLKALRGLMPSVGSIAGNPLDYWRAYEDPEELIQILELAFEDPSVDMIVVDRMIPRAAYHMPEMAETSSGVIEYMRKNSGRKPVVFTVDFGGGDPDLTLRGSDLVARFCRSGIPAYPGIGRALRALAHLCRDRERFRLKRSDQETIL